MKDKDEDLTIINDLMTNAANELVSCLDRLTNNGHIKIFIMAELRVTKDGCDDFDIKWNIIRNDVSIRSKLYTTED